MSLEIGINDLETMCKVKNKSNLLEYWNYARNDANGIKPTQVTLSSSKKVWWLCKECGCEWQATVASFKDSFNPSNCPCCSGRKLYLGVNDLASVYPELNKLWDYSRNVIFDMEIEADVTIKPTDVVYNSKNKYWWKCNECGNSYKAKIEDMINNTAECNHCRNKDKSHVLATAYPELLEYWDYEKNNAIGITPEGATSGMDKSVWWKCKKCGYEWQALISNRTRKHANKGCPKCYRKNKVNV